jgi:hypothetical protein
LLDALLGFLLFFFSIPSLFFNERRSVRQKQQVEDAFKICKAIAKDMSLNDIKNNELIFTTGDTQVQDLQSELLNVNFK